MKYLMVITLLISTNIHAFVLVCQGGQSIDPSQRAVYVDCNNKEDIVNTLGAAWQFLRKNGADRWAEDMCWKSYSSAQKLYPMQVHPDFGTKLFNQCNIATQNYK